jgi:twitching motility protein PilJ
MIMSSPRKLFYSSLFSSRNIFNLFLTLIFASITILGVWLLSTEQYLKLLATEEYLQFLDIKIHITGAVVSSFIITMLLTVRLSYLPIKILQTTLDEVALKNRRNRNAIIRLLEEIGGLENGDLTVSASVDDEVTASVADTFNSTIVDLRNLINKININTLQIAAAAQETQATAFHLTDASDHQAQQILEASHTIAEFTNSVEQVSLNSNHSLVMTTQSTNLTRQGQKSVVEAIHNIDIANENIQETSKLITRLIGNLQQVSELVELLNDTAEQTNILSLNAAIQASMADNSGHGFAVIADEVQRLAERSGKAARQIGSLIKTIQSDSNEAISSIEHATTKALLGNKHSRDASSSLEKTEALSHRLSEHINNITTTSGQQGKEALSASDNMNIIQEITMQASTGNNENIASIGRLLELTNELRTSASGYKLPL